MCKRREGCRLGDESGRPKSLGGGSKRPTLKCVVWLVWAFRRQRVQESSKTVSANFTAKRRPGADSSERKHP
jgi:hypothetical protein